MFVKNCSKKQKKYDDVEYSLHLKKHYTAYVEVNLPGDKK